MATTMTPNAMARDLSGKGRTVTAKMVRTVARQSLARFDKGSHPAYQSHEYNAADVKALRAAFAGRGSRKATTKAAPKRKSTRKVAAAASVQS